MDMIKRKAKIIATIGPSSQDEQTLETMIKTGMDITRLNFSHGTLEEHASWILRLRRISLSLGVPLGILQDLQGPKIRVGLLDKPQDLVKDDIVWLFPEKDTPPRSKKHTIPLDFPEMFQYTSLGDRILMDDGQISMQIVDVAMDSLGARVLVGGKLSSHKGVNLPGVHLSLPGFTKKDETDLAFGLNHGVDMVAISFVRSADDVSTVRNAAKRLSDDNGKPLIIAKLERAEALDNLDEILDEADGVMIARGDLGVEMPPESVPIAQKQIIHAANQHGKLVITATQMLDSMISNPLPTRAEASDIANAVFDGTDAVMLSGETAIGKYPIESIAMMNRIVYQAETNYKDWGHFYQPDIATQDDAATITRAARELAHDLNVTAIAVFTKSGRTAWMMSKARPRVQIIAFTPVTRTYQQMSLFWGVIPYLVPMAGTLSEMIECLDKTLISDHWAELGQQVVLITGFPVQVSRLPNMALLHSVGENLSGDI